MKIDQFIISKDLREGILQVDLNRHVLFVQVVSMIWLIVTVVQVAILSLSGFSYSLFTLFCAWLLILLTLVAIRIGSDIYGSILIFFALLILILSYHVSVTGGFQSIDMHVWVFWGFFPALFLRPKTSLRLILVCIALVLVTGLVAPFIQIDLYNSSSSKVLESELMILSIFRIAVYVFLAQVLVHKRGREQKLPKSWTLFGILIWIGCITAVMVNPQNIYWAMSMFYPLILWSSMQFKPWGAMIIILINLGLGAIFMIYYMPDWLPFISVDTRSYFPNMIGFVLSFICMYLLFRRYSFGDR